MLILTEFVFSCILLQIFKAFKSRMYKVHFGQGQKFRPKDCDPHLKQLL